LLAFSAAILEGLALIAQHQFLTFIALVAPMTLAHFRLSSQSFIIFLQACAAIVVVEEFHTSLLAI
jgi:hypothetical protein